MTKIDGMTTARMMDAMAYAYYLTVMTTTNKAPDDEEIRRATKIMFSAYCEREGIEPTCEGVLDRTELINELKIFNDKQQLLAAIDDGIKIVF